MMTNSKSGAIAVASLAALLLSACGSGQTSGPAPSAAASQGADISKLYNINAKPVDQLKQSGQVALPVGAVGPDFNYNDSLGNSSDNATMQAPMNEAMLRGCWSAGPSGKPVLDKNFCTSFTSEVKDGQQTLTIEINPKADWNDGAPIDYKTFQNTWKVFNGSNKDFSVISTAHYDQIVSVEPGANDKQVIVRTKAPTFPLEKFFGSLVNPAVNTPDIFNNGYTNNLHPEWMAGPYKLEKYDSAAKTVTEVPNEKWWGDKPLLDKITFRQLEPQATIAAFKNGEINEADGRTQTTYSELSGTKNSDIRRRERNFTGGMILNPHSADLKDVQIRQAVFEAVNREELRKVRFNGLNYTQEHPGSMLLMPFQKNYQDNWPVPADQQSTAAAKDTLKKAGYTEDRGGILFKNGASAKVTVSNFGDDPITLAYVKTMVKQFRDAGLDASIDQRSQAEWQDVVGKENYDITITGYGTTGGTADLAQFYSSTEGFKLGTPQLDERIIKVVSVADEDQQQKDSMNIERDWQKQYFVYGTVLNGPDIEFVTSGLANYGPSLFAPLDWTKVGWQK